MNGETKLNVAFVGSLAAVVVAGLALGVVYSSTQAPLAREAAALRGHNAFLEFQLEQMRAALPQVQAAVGAEKADAARLMDNLIYAFENEDNPDRDATKPNLAEAVNQAQGRIAQWKQQ